jgi:alpha-L-arabinofuranosidase
VINSSRDLGRIDHVSKVVKAKDQDNKEKEILIKIAKRHKINLLKLKITVKMLVKTKIAATIIIKINDFIL